MERALRETQQKYAALSRFVVYVMILVPIYDLSMVVLSRLRHLHHIPASAITGLSVLIFSLVLFHMIRKMGYPLWEFGLNLDKLRHNIWESLVWTFGFCLLLLVVKWLLITQTELFASWPLFYHLNPDHRLFEISAAAIYMVFAFFQCFIVHGAFQSPLMKLLATRRAVLLSIMITTLMFASMHIYMHFTFAIMTLLPGLMWSCLYARQRSLVGVTISHALVGLWAFWGLDLYQMMNVLFVRLSKPPGPF